MKKLSTGWIVLIVVAAIVFIGVVWGVRTNNRMITAEEGVSAYFLKPFRKNDTFVGFTAFDAGHFKVDCRRKDSACKNKSKSDKFFHDKFSFLYIFYG